MSVCVCGWQRCVAGRKCHGRGARGRRRRGDCRLAASIRAEGELQSRAEGGGVARVLGEASARASLHAHRRPGPTTRYRTVYQIKPVLPLIQARFEIDVSTTRATRVQAGAPFNIEYAVRSYARHRRVDSLVGRLVGHQVVPVRQYCVVEGRVGQATVAVLRVAAAELQVAVRTGVYDGIRRSI